jgi:hypothetical protein
MKKILTLALIGALAVTMLSGCGVMGIMKDAAKRGGKDYNYGLGAIPPTEPQCTLSFEKWGSIRITKFDDKEVELFYLGSSATILAKITPAIIPAGRHTLVGFFDVNANTLSTTRTGYWTVKRTFDFNFEAGKAYMAQITYNGDALEKGHAYYERDLPNLKIDIIEIEPTSK